MSTNMDQWFYVELSFLRIKGVKKLVQRAHFRLPILSVNYILKLVILIVKL
jgi:hypothetical protein